MLKSRLVNFVSLHRKHCENYEIHSQILRVIVDNPSTTHISVNSQEVFMKKGLVIALCAVMMAGLAGCGNTDAPKQSAVLQKVAEAPQKEDFKAITTIKPDQKNIYVVIKSFHNPYWQEVLNGMKKAGEAAHVNVYAGGVLADGAWEVQRDMIRGIDGAKMDALILGTADSLRIAEVTKELRDQKKPVILVDTMINTQDYDAAFLTNNLQTGADAAKEMISLLKEAGVSENDEITVAMQASNLSSRTESERLDSIIAAWYGMAPKNWKIDSQYLISYGDPAVAKELATSALQSNPNLKGIFAVNNNCTIAAMQSVMDLGRTDVAVMGFDMSETIEDGIAKEEYKFATIMQNPYKMGSGAVNAALAAIEGKPIPTRDVDTGAAVATHKNYKEVIIASKE